jgi:two-component system, cell cycle sensor histidine kinase and response regulator CckA
VAAIDVTERRRAEEILRANEARYRRFFEADLAGAFVTNAQGMVVDCNAAALRMLGYRSFDELRGRPAGALYKEPGVREAILEQLREHGRLDQVELELRKADAGSLRVLANILAEVDAEGHLTEVRSFFFDVTDRRKVEAQLRQSQKMDAIGRLAGGVAHDFNNLLGVITGYCELLGRDLARVLAQSNPALRRLQEIRKAADRAAGLTRQLLTFSRQQAAEPRNLDLNAVVMDIEKMLTRLIGEDIEIVQTLAPDLGCVRADAGQIEQVILNLAVNARDAMPEGGKLIIETANVDLDDRFVSAHPDVKPGRHVLLAVSDTGQGMTRETLSRVFEPFFTTKPQGKGTGLGLATVHGIVRQSGGAVDVYSEVGHGTSFKVYLPRVLDAAATAPRPVAPTPPPRGTERVLLMEDSDALRAMMLEILEASGYTVLEAADPGASIEALAEQAAGADLLISDVVMPHFSGPELAARIKATNPRARVLFISGYTDEMVARKGVLDADVHFLQKPFTFDGLLQKVRNVLDADRGIAA